MGMANLQRMAQQMQQEMLRVQTELEAVRSTARPAAAWSSAVVTGKQELVSVTIDPVAVDPADVEMLQDLVVAAVNDALRASRERGRAEDGRRDRRAANPGHVGTAEPRGHPAHRARRAADRVVRAPARASARRPPSA